MIQILLLNMLKTACQHSAYGHGQAGTSFEQTGGSAVLEETTLKWLGLIANKVKCIQNGLQLVKNGLQTTWKAMSHRSKCWRSIEQTICSCNALASNCVVL